MHTRYQQIAMLDAGTGELVERCLEHESGGAQVFCAGLFYFGWPTSAALGEPHFSRSLPEVGLRTSHTILLIRRLTPVMSHGIERNSCRALVHITMGTGGIPHVYLAADWIGE